MFRQIICGQFRVYIVVGSPTVWLGRATTPSIWWSRAQSFHVVRAHPSWCLSSPFTDTCQTCLPSALFSTVLSFLLDHKQESIFLHPGSFLWLRALDILCIQGNLIKVGFSRMIFTTQKKTTLASVIIRGRNSAITLHGWIRLSCVHKYFAASAPLPQEVSYPAHWQWRCGYGACFAHKV